jgi:hypothetical protein
MTRNISKDGVISLKPIRISKGTADAIELTQVTLQENPDFSKTIYAEFLKENVRYNLTWHGHDKEFLEETGFFYRMVDSFEFC